MSSGDQVPTPLSRGFVDNEYFKTVFKIGVSGIPFIGTALNEALYDAPSRMHQERLERFLFILTEQAKKLGADFDLFDQNKKEIFTEITNKVFIEASKTKSDLKLKTFASILTKSINVDLDKEAERYTRNIDMVASLTEIEMQFLTNLLHAISEREKDPNLKPREYFGLTYSVDYKQEIVLEIEVQQARIVIETLSEKRLIGDAGHGFYDYTPNSSIGFTPLGRDFINFIEVLSNK